MKQLKSKKSATTVGAALATSVLATALISAVPTVAFAKSTERCGDVVKGGKNTCAVTSLVFLAKVTQPKTTWSARGLKYQLEHVRTSLQFVQVLLKHPKALKRRSLLKLVTKLPIKPMKQLLVVV